MHKDLYNNAKSVVAVPLTILVSNGDTVGVIIDTDGFESGTITLLATVVTTGDVTISSIGESSESDMTGETPIPAARLIGTASGVTSANTLDELGFVSTERYIRVTVTGANTSALSFAALCTLADPSNAPVER